MPCVRLLILETRRRWCSYKFPIVGYRTVNKAGHIKKAMCSRLFFVSLDKYYLTIIGTYYGEISEVYSIFNGSKFYDSQVSAGIPVGSNRGVGAHG